MHNAGCKVKCRVAMHCPRSVYTNVLWFGMLLIGWHTGLAQGGVEPGSQSANDTISVKTDSVQRTSFWRKLHPDSLTNRPLKFIPLPVLQTGPEIGVKGGITLDYFFNAGTGQPYKRRFHSRYWQRLDSVERTTRDSYAFVHALYSTRRQLTIEGVWNTYGAAERYVLRGRGGYIDFSEDYWGVGNQTVSERDFAVLSYQRWYVQNRAWRRLGGRVFAGLSYQYSDTRNMGLNLGRNFPNACRATTVA
ncbi:hypothetical protein [Spirosoma montaniterrae]|nr:hypothetical protein [Spirosoma montaniterrae]